MQSSVYCRDTSNTPLGERRGKSDLARFSLDLDWARGASNPARSRPYPSPPMSGSPLPPQRNPEFDDRGQSSFGASTQDVSRSWQTSQADIRDTFRGVAPGPPYQQEPQATPHPQYQRVGDVPVEQSQYQYHPRPPPPPSSLPPQQQQRPIPQTMASLPMYSLHHPHTSSHFQHSESFPIGEAHAYAQKGQRKTKGHVASACVPCKRAHLRCDSQRPCSRCISNGKEEACIDVQHKKRGRPRLRDEREPRFEGLGQAFAPQHDQLRRPVSVYSPVDPAMHQSDAHARSGPYRVLKSQNIPSNVPRYIDHASPADANVFTGQISPNQRAAGGYELPWAYLTLDMQICDASRTFGELVGMSSIGGRKLLDIVAADNKDKVYRLQLVFESERKEREPNYLPPIYGKAEEERVIRSIGVGPDGSVLRNERQEFMIFQDPSGQTRGYQARLGLSKKDSTYFVILILVWPATPATPATSHETYHMSSSPYAPREAGFPYRTPQQNYAAPVSMPVYSQYHSQYNDSRAHDPQLIFRQPPSLISNSSSVSGPASGMPAYAQAAPRTDYRQSQNPGQISRGEAAPVESQRQSEYRLPPIQSQPGAAVLGPRGDERGGGRVDIGELLENPEIQRK